MACKVNFSCGHNRHGHAGGTIGTGCEGGGVTGRSEVGTLSISASVFTVSRTRVSTEGVTLFSQRSGTEYHGAGTIATLLGCGGAPCEITRLISYTLVMDLNKCAV